MAQEAHVERACRVIAEQRGAALLKLGAALQRGIPDRVLLLQGRAVFIEFKSPGKYPTPIQRHWHAKLRGLGFEVVVFRTVAEFRALLDKLNEEQA
jgi:hypothetical protein